MKPIDKRSAPNRISKTRRILGSTEFARVQERITTKLVTWNKNGKYIRGAIVKVGKEEVFAPNIQYDFSTYKRKRRHSLKNGFYLKDIAP